MIPDEAVEAAARAIYGVFPSLTDPDDEGTAVLWEDASEQRRAEDRMQARAALEAAAPHLMASAASELARMEAIGQTPVRSLTSTDEAEYTAYIKAGSPSAWLRARAEEMRRR